MVRRRKILIIDDDPVFASATKSVLEGDYDVSCACDGREGWQKLKEEKPDLIILDGLVEKRSNGFILRREMRRDKSFHDIPVIMLTGMGPRRRYSFVAKETRDAGVLSVDLFMEKPVNPPDLLINIESLLRRRDALRGMRLKQSGTRQASHKRILVVEPDKEVAEEYRGIFSDEGYDVEIVSSVTEAVREVKDVQFNCAIVDVDLPDMAGYDAVSVIKTIQPEIDIIITAAKNSKELEFRVRKEGIFYYYIKSFEREELKLAVRSVMTESRG